jgi:hypothetical protein
MLPSVTVEPEASKRTSAVRRSELEIQRGKGNSTLAPFSLTKKFFLRWRANFQSEPKNFLVVQEHNPPANQKIFPLEGKLLK